MIQAVVLMVVIAIVGATAYEPSVDPPIRTDGPSQPVIPPPLAAAATSPPVVRPIPPIPPVRTFDEPAKKLPANGAYGRHWSHYEGEVLAPLRIITATGSPNYFVKVVGWERGSLVLTVFIRSGQMVHVEVPVGS